MSEETCCAPVLQEEEKGSGGGRGGGDEPDRHPTGPNADIPSEVGGPCKSA